MAVITGIVASTRKEGRFVLQVDGAVGATVSLDILDRLKLRVGTEVDEALAARIAEEGGALAAYDRALNMLAFQARSSRDLRRKLVQKGEVEAHAQAAVERLVAAGLLDDAEYARQVARSKVAGQGASKRRLQQELFKRGVERGVADAAIGEVLSDEGVDEGEIVERFARKKLKSLAALDAPTRRRRLYAYLARRGYEGDVIRRAMSRVLGEGEREALEALDAIEASNE
jgi:regulatory protein